MGRKKKPIWALVAADSRAPRDGRFIEDLGRYYPLEEPARVELKDDRIKHWLKVGAQPTDTVRSLLSQQGVLLGLHLEYKGVEPDAIAEAVTAHQEYHQEKRKASAKVTTSELRQQELEAEEKAALKLEAETLEKRKKAAAAAADAKAREKEEVSAEDASADDEAVAEEEVSVADEGESSTESA